MNLKEHDVELAEGTILIAFEPEGNIHEIGTPNQAGKIMSPHELIVYAIITLFEEENQAFFDLIVQKINALSESMKKESANEKEEDSYNGEKQ